MSSFWFSIVTKCNCTDWNDVLSCSVQTAGRFRSNPKTSPVVWTSPFCTLIFIWTLKSGRVSLFGFTRFPCCVSLLISRIQPLQDTRTHQCLIYFLLLHKCVIIVLLVCKINGKSCPPGFSWDYRARWRITPPHVIFSFVSTCKWSSCKQ